MFQISAPTKKQLIHALELATVTFVGTFVMVWTKQPDPFSKAAVIAALSGGVAALYGIAKGILLAE